MSSKRELEIINEAKYNRKYINGLGAFAEAFKQGALWADENPNEFNLMVYDITKIAIEIDKYENLSKNITNNVNNDILEQIDILKNKLHSKIIKFNNYKKLHYEKNI